MYRSLIIDDEKSVHKVINIFGRWLEFGIAPPASAYDGQSGLFSMRELKPEIVFLDMKMPKIDGTDFLKTAVPEFPKTKFIVVSGYDAFSYAKIAIQYHVLDYLLKPIEKDELNSVLQKACKMLNNENHVNEQAPRDLSSVEAGQLAEAVKEYLEKNYTDKINLSEFANYFHFSKEYISKLFKDKYNTGIYEYVSGIRMKRAKELLLNSDLHIQTISERLGYSDSNYFSKAFRNYYGISPTKFKMKKSTHLC